MGSSFLTVHEQEELLVDQHPIPRVRTGPGNPGKSWNFILAFSRTGKSWKINAGPGKSWKSISSSNKGFFKTIFFSIIFGFLFRKGLLLQLLCILKSWKNVFES